MERAPPGSRPLEGGAPASCSWPIACNSTDAHEPATEALTAYGRFNGCLCREASTDKRFPGSFPRLSLHTKGSGMTLSVTDLERIDADRQRIRRRYLKPSGDRPTSSARGVHHVAVLCADVERTVRFYQDLLEFPLIEIFENRDYKGSTHFFFDIGHGNALAFFDLPGLNLARYAEVLGGLHHLAISVPPKRWANLKNKLDVAGIAYLIESDTSLYLRDPDGTRLELIADPLGEM